MNRATVFMILGMALVTYIPRAIPAALSEKLRFSPKAEKFLRLIPYTAMAAIIVPGVFTVDTAHPAVPLMGAALAAVLGFRRRSVMTCVLAAVAAEFLLYLLVL